MTDARRASGGALVLDCQSKGLRASRGLLAPISKLCYCANDYRPRAR
jgi:hypothetical protein